jgi:hypothetical protein
MDFIGFQIVISLTAVIICLIFFMAFGMKNKSRNIKKSKNKELQKELRPLPLKIKSRTRKPLSILDPHQPNYIKRQFNYG